MSISSILPVYARADLTLDHGEGAYVYTKDGEKYLDFLSGIAVNSLGHCHPHLVKALQAQAAKLWHVSNVFYSEPLKKLSDRLVDTTFADTVFFCNSGHRSGSKPALRRYANILAKAANQKNIASSLSKARFMAAQWARLPLPARRKPPMVLARCCRASIKLRVNIEAVKKAITKETAAILIEPVQGEGGISVEPLKILPELRKICDENGLLLFLDEVQCGVGRTGKFFAYEWTGHRAGFDVDS